MGGDIKLLTTQCVVLEIEALGKTFILVYLKPISIKTTQNMVLLIGTAVRQAMHIVKNFGIHKCGHEKKPISGANCFMSMTKNNMNTR